MILITKKQEKAINALNAALKRVHELDIKICGMDSTLHYATKRCIEKYKQDGRRGSFCDVANCVRLNDEGSGNLFSECYEDSGGW